LGFHTAGAELRFASFMLWNGPGCLHELA
jgi:hypothetical protein